MWTLSSEPPTIPVRLMPVSPVAATLGGCHGIHPHPLLRTVWSRRRWCKVCRCNVLQLPEGMSFHRDMESFQQPVSRCRSLWQPEAIVRREAFCRRLRSSGPQRPWKLSPSRLLRASLASFSMVRSPIGLLPRRIGCDAAWCCLPPNRPRNGRAWETRRGRQCRPPDAIRLGGDGPRGCPPRRWSVWWVIRSSSAGSRESRPCASANPTC